MDLKILVEVGLFQHWHFHQNAFQGLKGLVACSIPFVNFNKLFQEVCQGCGHFRKVFDELAIIGG